MKKAFRHLLATLLALAMVCALAAPVFADTEDLSNHNFTAYQIFKGDVVTVGNDTKLSNATWGNNVDANAILTDLTTKSDFTTQFNGITLTSSAADVVAKMANMNETDPVTIAFAKMVAKHLKGTGTQFGGTSFTAPEAGYYLIRDTTGFDPNSTNKNRTKQFSLLKVTQAGTVTITSKVAKPTVKIEVEKSDGSWGKSTDAAIGDKCNFRLTATLPESTSHAYDYYNNYTIWFTNILSASFSEMSALTVKVDGTLLDLTNSNITNNSSGTYVDLIIKHLKDHVTDLNAGATVTVEFTAKLNNSAAITTKDGVNTTNISTAQLSFSNDPAHSDHITDGMGTTAEDKAYVYTYGMEINKGDAATKAPLKDAKFKLYPTEACTAGTELKFTKGSTGAYYYDANGTAEMVSNDAGKITIKGLKPGTYWLKETEAPAGYNKVNDPLGLTFIPIHDTTGASVTLNGGLNLNFDPYVGMNVTVENKAGVVLPSTGGMGTTIFYVVGGLLMVGAAVLLVTKKRMQKN